MSTDPNSVTSLVPVGRAAPVYLTSAAYTSQRAGEVLRLVSVSDAYRPSLGWTSCLLPGHAPGRTPRRLVDAVGYHLDCACDVACPRCRAPIGSGCWTVDGGGESGGGYSTSLHAVRIKSSPRCQALLDRAITRCDLGDHDWAIAEHGTEPVAVSGGPVAAGTAGTARCGSCGRVGPLQPRRSELWASRHWIRHRSGLA